MAERFPFPNKDPQVRQRFNNLCKVLSQQQIEAIKESISQKVEKLSAAEGMLIGPNIRVAVKLGEVSQALLERYSALDEASQALVAGAVCYFLAELDLTPDATPIIGFDDDVRILNHVLEQVGLSDLYIPQD